ncbi:hypothetical protein A7982_12065 [Minicystis rosea]|nr:hypothetical protein A7982_12065 [Minicystis rosea]
MIIARAPRDVTLLDRAIRDLEALPSVERQMLARQIDALSRDMVPRGAAALDGARRDHLRIRVGRFRILYSIIDHELVIVAITARVD